MADVKQLVEEGRAVTVCPEVMGGMTTPRIPSERKDGKIINLMPFLIFKRQESIFRYWCGT